jgi:GGDEF domain-containing protein
MFSKRLRESIESHNKEINKQYKLSLSIGFSYYDFKNPIPLEDLIAQADSDMYKKKREKS